MMVSDPPDYVKNPNPQGKGVVPLISDWLSVQPALRGPKAATDFLRDYCMSSLVLASTFRFKPVVGNTYFLYSTDESWSLSLVGPREWGLRIPGEFVASCRLRPDMTWELEATYFDEESPALAKVRGYICGFVETLAGQESIANHLPFYAADLPYYQRLLATALASSLQRSLPDMGEMKALLAEQSGMVAISALGAR